VLKANFEYEWRMKEESKQEGSCTNNSLKFDLRNLDANFIYFVIYLGVHGASSELLQEFCSSKSYNSTCLELTLRQKGVNKSYGISHFKILSLAFYILFNGKVKTPFVL